MKLCGFLVFLRAHKMTTLDGASGWLIKRDRLHAWFANYYSLNKGLNFPQHLLSFLWKILRHLLIRDLFSILIQQ
jgi:hypothetical protein